MPELIMLAGPNGAGKSTYYEAYLSHFNLPFVNADVLSNTLGVDAYTAASEASRIRNSLLEQRQSFVSETVFSDPVGDKVNFLIKAVQSGYDVDLIYIGIESPSLSQIRVKARVASGGHDVPTAKLSGRYERSLSNLQRAIVTLPRVLLYDNSSYDTPHRFLMEFRNGTIFRTETADIPEWARNLVTLQPPSVR